MTTHDRPSPKGKRASLFVTCIVDMIYPNTGMSVVEVLERLGVEVDFPESQTCCGQMGFNAGYRDDATAVARHFIEAFKDAEVIVSPSGSCVTMVREFYPQLFADDPVWRERTDRIVSITWELTEYLVDGLGVTDVGTVLDQPMRATVHHACHGLRGLGLKAQAQQLLSNVKNLELVDLPGAEQCCGFGGLFAVKMPDVSGAMLNDKIAAIQTTTADVVITGDASCQTQINGGLSRQQCGQRVVHIADILAGKVNGKHG